MDYTGVILLAFVILVVLLGACATIFSREFTVSWAFLLVDIPLVAISAAIAYLAVGKWTKKWQQSGTARMK